MCFCPFLQLLLSTSYLVDVNCHFQLLQLQDVSVMAATHELRPEVPEMQLGRGQTTLNARGPPMKGKLRCAGVVACRWMLTYCRFQ